MFSCFFDIVQRLYISLLNLLTDEQGIVCFMFQHICVTREPPNQEKILRIIVLIVIFIVVTFYDSFFVKCFSYFQYASIFMSVFPYLEVDTFHLVNQWLIDFLCNYIYFILLPLQHSCILPFNMCLVTNIHINQK